MITQVAHQCSAKRVTVLLQLLGVCKEAKSDVISGNVCDYEREVQMSVVAL